LIQKEKTLSLTFPTGAFWATMIGHFKLNSVRLVTRGKLE